MRDCYTRFLISIFAIMGQSTLAVCAGEAGVPNKCITPTGKAGFLENKHCEDCNNSKTKPDACKVLLEKNPPKSGNRTGTSKSGLTDDAGGLTKPNKIILKK